MSQVAMNYWPLLGVAWVVVGFVLRFNPVAVVVSAGLVSGFAAGKTLSQLLALLGESFVSNRALLLFALTLPTIGLLERAGLREHALRWIARLRGLTLSRLLTGYLAARQGLSMLGLIDIAGHAQTVRPLLAPMTESAAEKTRAPLQREEKQRVHALAAATDNVGRFFGEDVADDGRVVALRADTLCLHGDRSDAAAFARAVRTALEADGVDIRACDDVAP